MAKRNRSIYTHSRENEFVLGLFFFYRLRLNRGLCLLTTLTHCHIKTYGSITCWSSSCRLNFRQSIVNISRALICYAVYNVNSPQVLWSNNITWHSIVFKWRHFTACHEIWNTQFHLDSSSFSRLFWVSLHDKNKWNWAFVNSMKLNNNYKVFRSICHNRIFSLHSTVRAEQILWIIGTQQKQNYMRIRIFRICWHYKFGVIHYCYYYYEQREREGTVKIHVFNTEYRMNEWEKVVYNNYTWAAMTVRNNHVEPSSVREPHFVFFLSCGVSNVNGNIKQKSFSSPNSKIGECFTNARLFHISRNDKQCVVILILICRYYIARCYYLYIFAFSIVWIISDNVCVNR